MSRRNRNNRRAARAAAAADAAPRGLTTAQALELDYLVRFPQQQPPRTWTYEEVRACYSLPETVGAAPEVRDNFEHAFDSIGGFTSIQNSLNSLGGHIHAMGQMPLQSFMGYGALQRLTQDGLIRAAISTVVDDVTRRGINVIGGEEEDAERVEKLNDLVNRYKLMKVFHDAVELTGYFGGAFIFIDTGASEEDLQYPLAINSKSSELRRGAKIKFKVVDPSLVTPAEYNVTNPLADDYMKPRAWFVLGQKLHASRLLVMVDNEPPAMLKPAYNFLGVPRAQILADYVAHYKEARDFTNELLRKSSLLVLKTDTDAIFSTPDGVRNFDTKLSALQRYRDCGSVWVCDKDREDMMNVQTPFAGTKEIVQSNLEMVAAINRTPAVKLLGISPSGFNATGESDLNNYHEFIDAYRELFREQLMTMLKVIQLVTFGDVDRTISFEFGELSQDNDASKAMTISTRMQTLSTAVQTQIISAQEARDYVRKDRAFGLDFLSEEAPDEEPQDMDGLDDFPGMGQQQPQQPQAAAPQQPAAPAGGLDG